MTKLKKPREIEGFFDKLMQLLADGLTPSQAYFKLEVTCCPVGCDRRKQIEYYLRTKLKRLGYKTLYEAVADYARQGLVVFEVDGLRQLVDGVKPIENNLLLDDNDPEWKDGIGGFKYRYNRKEGKSK